MSDSTSLSLAGVSSRIGYESPSFSSAVTKSKNSDELLSLNRIPSAQEISLMKKIIFDDTEELAALESRIEKRQAAVDLSQKNVDEIQATIDSLEIIQSARKKQLDADMDAQRKLSGTELPPVSSVTPQEGYEIPKLSNISSYCLIGLQRCQTRIQEGIEETDQSNRWMSELCQKHLESRSRLKEETSSLEAIKACASQLRKEIGRRNQLISVIRRLPSEILQLIFRSYIRKETEEIKETWNRPQSRAVTTLSAVCARWRRLVAASPSLWTYIPIPKPSNLSTYQKFTARLTPYIKRVRKHVILDYPRGGPWEVEVTKTFVSPSKKSSIPAPRTTTEHISVTDGLKYFEENMLSPNSFQWTGVSSFEIFFRKTSDPLDTAQCLWSAESYCIRNGSLRFSTIQGSSVHHLTLHLPKCSASYLQTAMQNLTKLRTFELVVKSGDITGEASTNMMELTHLSQLSSNTHLLALLLNSYIRAPSLCQLGVLGQENDSVDDWELLGTNLSLQNIISSVRLSNAASHKDVEERFIPMLRTLSSVEKIELEGQYFLPLLEYLCSNQHVGTKVHTVIFRKTDIREDILRRFITGHLVTEEPPKDGHLHRRITNITFDNCTEITQSFCEEIKGLVSQLSVYC